MLPKVCSLAADKLICVIEDTLQLRFSDYSEKGVEDFDCVRDPLGVPPTFLPLKAHELTEMKADRTFKLKLHELSLDTFWRHVREEYPVIPYIAATIFDNVFM
jgi:hypothetical protein